MTPSRTTRLIAILIAVFFIAPTLVIVAASFTSGRVIEFPPRGFSVRWYEEVLTDPDWTSAFLNSVKTGVLAAVLAAVVGTLLALAVVRGRHIPKGLVTALAATPMVVPLVIVGLSAYLMYVKVGMIGNVFGLGVAHAALGVPFVFINVLAQLTTLDSRIEDAARSCGANEIKVFFLVTLPLILPGTLIGALLAFVTSWDEVVVAVFMATPDFRTVPIEIFGQLREGVQPSTAAVATVVTAISLIILAIVSLVRPLRARRLQARHRRLTP